MIKFIAHLSEHFLLPSHIVRELSAISATAIGPDDTHLNIRYRSCTCWQRTQKDLKSTQALNMSIYECDAGVTDITLGAIWQGKLGIMLFDGGIQTAPATTPATGVIAGAVWAVAIAIAIGETQSVKARTMAHAKIIASSFRDESRPGCCGNRLTKRHGMGKTNHVKIQKAF